MWTDFQSVAVEQDGLVDATREFPSRPMATLEVVLSVGGLEGIDVIGAISGEVTKQRRSDTVAEKGAVRICIVHWASLWRDWHFLVRSDIYIHVSAWCS